jgi:hypothetical protein
MAIFPFSSLGLVAIVVSDTQPTPSVQEFSKLLEPHKRLPTAADVMKTFFGIHMAPGGSHSW